MRCAYADLPAEQQKRLEGVVGVHDFSWSNGLLIRHWASAGKTPGQPPARHYVVRQTPHGPCPSLSVASSHSTGLSLAMPQ